MGPIAGTVNLCFFSLFLALSCFLLFLKPALVIVWQAGKIKINGVLVGG